jgi:hypothetical protein
MRRIALGFVLGIVVGAGAMHALSDGGPAPDPKPDSVITGQDLGFRVEKIESRQVVGTLVVRVNGEWKEPAPPVRVVPARP